MTKKLFLILALLVPANPVFNAYAMETTPEKELVVLDTVDQQPTPNPASPIDIGFFRSACIMSACLIAGAVVKHFVPKTPLTLYGFELSSNTVIDYASEAGRVCHLKGWRHIMPDLLKKCLIDNTNNKLKNMINISVPTWSNAFPVNLVPDMVTKTALSSAYDATVKKIQMKTAPMVAKAKNYLLKKQEAIQNAIADMLCTDDEE